MKSNKDIDVFANKPSELSNMTFPWDKLESAVRLLTFKSPLEGVWRAFLISLCKDESVHYTKGSLFTSTEDVFRI